jgi:hypothetical protein
MAANRDTYQAARAANITTSTTNGQVFLQALNSAKAAILYVPANVKKFRVRAGGRATGGTTTNFTPTIQKGSSLTAASNTTIAALTARAVDAATGVWDMVVDCTLDETNSKLIVRLVEGHNGLTPTIEAAAIKTSLSSITQTVLNGMAIVLAGTFSAADAANVGILDYFSLEVLDVTK